MNPTSSNTLLTYSLDTAPDPLQASPLTGNTVYGALSFVVSNGGSTVVQLSQLQFTIPIGALAQDLTSNPSAILWSTSPNTLWNVTMTSPGVFLLVPQSGSPIAVSTDGMVIQFYNAPINQQVGTVAIAVNETATNTSDPAQSRAATFDVAKFPYGFYFGNFTAQVPMVAEGSSATLTWAGSDNATYAMQWSLAPATDVTNIRSWSSPALTSDTTFVLQATVVSQGETVTRDLSTTVIVANPELQASTLQVTGTSNLQGATLMGGPLTANAVTATSVSASSATLSGAVSAASVTSSGALSSASLTSGATSVSSLLVGAPGVPPANQVTVNVPASFTSSVAMVNSVQSVSSGVTYTAATDGMVVGSSISALINGNAGKVSLAWVYGSCSNGLQIWATVGNTQFYPNWMCINNQSFCMPVPKGSTFSVSVVYGNSFNNQINPTYQFSFVPFGSSNSAALTEMGQAAVPPAPPDGAFYLETPENALLQAVAQILMDSGTDDQRARLAQLLTNAFPANESSKT